MLFCLTFYSLKNPEKSIAVFKKKLAAQLLPTLIILIINQQIRMISKVLCDTLDWSYS